MDRRRVALWVGIFAAVLLGLCGVGVAALAFVARGLGGDGQWTVLHQAPAQFHLKTKATDFHYREQGFQDPYFELIFEVSDVDGFLAGHGLTKAGPAHAPNDAPVKPESAVELDGFVDDHLHRSGQLWKVGPKTFVYLVAFGT